MPAGRLDVKSKGRLVPGLDADHMVPMVPESFLANGPRPQLTTRRLSSTLIPS